MQVKIVNPENLPPELQQAFDTIKSFVEKQESQENPDACPYCKDKDCAINSHMHKVYTPEEREQIIKEVKLGKRTKLIMPIILTGEISESNNLTPGVDQKTAFLRIRKKYFHDEQFKAAFDTVSETLLELFPDV